MEPAQPTHAEEFYDGDLALSPINEALLAWERVRNNIRPHHSQDGRTPAKFLQQRYPQLVPTGLSHMY